MSEVKFKHFSLFFGDEDMIKKIGRDKLVSFWVGDDGRIGITYAGSECGVYHSVVVDGEDYWCSCMGYTIRGKCKHIEWAKEDVKKINEVIK